FPWSRPSARVPYRDRPKWPECLPQERQRSHQVRTSASSGFRSFRCEQTFETTHSSFVSASHEPFLYSSIAEKIRGTVRHQCLKPRLFCSRGWAIRPSRSRECGLDTVPPGE